MNLNKVISIFNNSSINNLKKEDLTDITKKNDAAVKTAKNIFDINLDGKLDNTELALIDKLANLDGNNTGISITDLKLFAAMNGSAGDISFGDLSILKNGKYSTENNGVSTYDLNQNKTSTTTINNDGSVTTTAYSHDKTQTVTEYASDYKIKSKTATHTSGAQEQYQYNEAGILIQKNEILLDRSKVTTLYNDDGKISTITKKDANNNFLSQEEYDYDDNGNKSSITGYNSSGNESAKALYSEDGSKIQVKYDDNGEIIQRDTFNSYSKPLTSFVKNADGSTVSIAYDYKPNRDIQTTTITTNADGTQQSEQISIKHSNGNKEFYTDDVLVQKDEFAGNGSLKSTVYSAKDIIDTITEKDPAGNITKTDSYTYTGTNIDTITEKDAQGKLVATGHYNYDNPDQIKSLDHFDATGNLIDKAVWNLDGTKTTYKYNVTINNVKGTLIENYGTDDKLTSSVFNLSTGCKLSSTYTYDIPNAGDTTINSINTTSDGTVNSNQNVIVHKDGTSETTTYNADKTQCLQKDTVDKYGIKTTTLYNNNQITSVTKTNSSGNVTGTDNYNYTDGILVSINHIGFNNKSIGTTQYDQDGNTKDFDSIGRIISSKTTDKITGAITTESYQYLANGDKIVKTGTKLNEKLQSAKTQIIHLNKSGETSIYDSSGYNLLQKDQVSADGKIKSALYDPVKHRITSVINKDANNNILLRNEYNYATTGTAVDHIDCFDVNNNLVQTIQYVSNAQKIITNYDSSGNVKNTATYDKDGNIVSIL